MAQITDLSNELLIMIGGFLDGYFDGFLGGRELSALTRTSRHFRLVFTSALDRYALHTYNQPTAFYWACAAGNSELANTLAMEGTDFSVIAENPRRILFRDTSSTYDRRRGAREALLLGGAVIVKDNNTGYTPLHTAVLRGRNITLQSLLEMGGFNMIDYKDIYGRTALHIAVCKGNEIAVRLLLSKSALPNTRCRRGFTPLHYAASGGNQVIAELLLDSGASQEIRSNCGKIPVEMLSGDVEMMALLLERIDPGFRTRDGRTALHLAVNAELTGCEGEEYEDILFEIVDTLLGRRIPVNEQENSGGYTALHVYLGSGRHGTCSVLELLFDNGANPNIQDFYGQTSLHILTVDLGWFGEYPIAELMEHGADINIRDHNGETIIDLVDDSEDMPPCLYMLEMAERDFRTIRSGKTLLHLAVPTLCLPFIHELLDDGLDINDLDNYGRNALHYLVDCYDSSPAHKELTRSLVDRGADVNARDCDGDTPADLIDLLSVGGPGWVVDQLDPIFERLDINFRVRTSRRSVLHFAAIWDRLALARTFIERGGDINTLDWEGLTPLDFALRSPRNSVIDLLLENGAVVGLEGDRFGHFWEDYGQS